jgi:hypothetical protein
VAFDTNKERHLLLDMFWMPSFLVFASLKPPRFRHGMSAGRQAGLAV